GGSDGHGTPVPVSGERDNLKQIVWLIPTHAAGVLVQPDLDMRAWVDLELLACLGVPPLTEPSRAAHEVTAPRIPLYGIAHKLLDPRGLRVLRGEEPTQRLVVADVIGVHPFA